MNVCCGGSRNCRASVCFRPRTNFVVRRLTGHLSGQAASNRTKHLTSVRSAELSEVASSPTEAKDRLSPEQLDSWQSCTAMLTDLGFAEEDADRLLAKGFAWTSRGYWGMDLVDSVPDPGQVIEVMQFLNTLEGLTEVETQKIMKTFPEVLACSVEDRLIPNIQRLEREWFMKGTVLKGAVVRKPAVLGLSVDCSTVGAGACMGQCRKCWSAN